MAKYTLTFLVFLLIPAFVYASEADIQRQDIFHEVGNAFRYDDFDRLEELSQEFLREKSRIGTGAWKLTTFHFAIQNVTEDANGNDEIWYRIFEKSAKWLEQYPDSPTAMVVKGELLSTYAWQIRGGGLGHAVPEEDLIKFLQALDIAKDYLLSVKDTASKNPEWYSTMANISKGLNASKKDFMAIIKEGTDKHPEYYPIYYAAMIYLMPRWHGSLQEMDEFANYAAKKTKETDRLGLYARSYWYVFGFMNKQERIDFFKFHNIDWEKMKKGIYDVTKQYPDQNVINLAAILSCYAKDKEATSDFMSKMTETDMSQWKTTRFKDQCFSWTRERLVEDPDDESNKALISNHFGVWIEQLSFSLPQTDFNVYADSINYFYGEKVREDYSRDLKIKSVSACNDNNSEQSENGSIEELSQTREQLIEAETSNNFQKLYDSFEHEVKNIELNEELNEATIDYNLKLTGNIHRIFGFADSETENFTFEEFRSCKGKFIYSEYEFLLRSEECQILIKEGCKE